MKNNIILGYELLGKELVKQTNWNYLSRPSNENFDYVDKTAELIIKLTNNDIKGLRNVGAELKSMYDSALETQSDVIKSKCNARDPRGFNPHDPACIRPHAAV